MTRDNDKANAEITRITERRHRAADREKREIEAQNRAYWTQEQRYITAAAALDGDAIRHLRNTTTSWLEMSNLTGRSIEELQQAMTPTAEYQQRYGPQRDGLD